MELDNKNVSFSKQPMSKDSNTFIKLNSFSLRKKHNEKVTELYWSIRNNYPRLTLNTDTKVFDFANMIIAPFDYITLISFIDKFLEMLDVGEQDVIKISCKNNKFIRENGKNIRTDEKIIQAEVVLGITSKGVAYISCTRPGEEKIAFPILLNREWFNLYDKEGVEVNELKILSLKYAKNYFKQLKETLSKYLSEANTVRLITYDKNSKDENKPTDNQTVKPDSLQQEQLKQSETNTDTQSQHEEVLEVKHEDKIIDNNNDSLLEEFLG